MLKVIFWQNMLSPHLSFLIDKLADFSDVTAAVVTPIENWRLTQGWSLPNYGKANIIQIKSRQDALDIYRRFPNHIQVFSGINSYSFLEPAFNLALKSGKVFIISEAPITMTHHEYLLKRFLYLFRRLKYGHSIEAVFTMGDLGVNWFLNCGFKQTKVFNFQYFVETPLINNFNELAKSSNPNHSKTSFLFIGQLIYRKGIDKLIKVLGELDNNNWHLTIIGNGELKNSLIAQVERLNLEKFVTFKGQLSNIEAMSILLNKTDYLILPSRFDGWGAVVNEALVRGVPVITNDKCGASSLISNGINGFTYKQSSKKSFSSIIERAINNSAQLNTPKSRQNIHDHYIEYSNRSIRLFIQQCEQTNDIA